MNDRYFELELMIENLARNFGVPNANCYFRLSRARRPSRNEYRRKVAEFMLEYLRVLDAFKGLDGYDDLKRFVDERLRHEVERVLDGRNRDVEKRYDYYVMNE
ncbi:MAG: hypothetical protein RMJ59_01160 [Candidatus Nitrosocaldus sp.]|nr:hypothetical protein [Candidatus Nitrosocaldus sp.]MDW8274973.1 hypothetical protein [Candidatus Nitrosocaldus sp.]